MALRILKTLSAFFLVPFCAVLAVLAGCQMIGGGKMQLCTHTYALCTSALCVPQPGNTRKAICFCDVYEGKSMSTAPCENLRPETDAKGIRTIYSTFSYEQANTGKKVLKCPGGTPWTWCLNKKCTIDPANPNQAICLCDVMRSQEPWITFGGDCAPETCSTSYWSGASIKDFNQAESFMTRELNLNASPIAWCETDLQ
jgi:hypothetical protein